MLHALPRSAAGLFPERKQQSLSLSLKVACHWGPLLIASVDHMDTFGRQAKKVSFFVGVGTASHMARAEVTELARGCIVLSQGEAVNHEHDGCGEGQSWCIYDLVLFPAQSALQPKGYL